MNEVVKAPGFGKRILSHTLDFLFVFLVGLLLFVSVSSTFFLQAIGGIDDRENAYRFLGDSSLFSLTEKDGVATDYAAKIYAPDVTATSGSAPAQTERGYVLYLNDCYHFYTDFLGSDLRVSPVALPDGSTIAAKDYYNPTHFYTAVMGFSAPEDVTVSEESSRAGSNPYFMYALTTDGTALDLTAEPLLRSEYAAKAAEGNADALASLNAYFYYRASDGGYSGLYITAGNLVIAEPYFSLNSKSFDLKVWASFAVVAAPLILFDFLILPLCDKGQRTLGKMITGLAVVDPSGAALRGRRRIFHPLLMTVEALLALIYPLTIGFLVFLLVSLIDYTSAVVSKSHLSFHEKIAATRVIEAKTASFSLNRHRRGGFPSASLSEAPSSSEETVLDLGTIKKSQEEAASIGASLPAEEKTPPSPPKEKP